MTEQYRSRFRTLTDGSDSPPGADHHIFIGPQHPWAEEPAHFNKWSI